MDGSSWGANINVAFERVALVGVAGTNVLRDFEVFHGTSHADLFRDGRGDHIYTGSDGADLFVFGRRHGQDKVTDFDGAAGDVIRFLAISTAMDSYEDVLANASDNPGAGGLVISTGFNSTLILANVTKDTLQADWFQFA